ncbi:hypothetical protein A3J13_01575 [Candidatus Daviesbacteria bacterium RIFCSPLOWO2_02_FULL_36_8]|uniref:Pseudouridine synthase RsuA/RluA-like domain-containing protein n=1 Tax=Candidatus Daviesbacteria bacterium RIFCSPLOWO2_02_FULL_36_8 TaxID=1797793 RepID=A0A1F5MGY2_9BACT|nr:MAG: hypothetical protein A3J13_01575 [Candidatus Daviesbacteria bacterium RIFCSPLOWO2_02_FULL_36_8]
MDQVKIIYQDKDILVVDKPSGLVVDRSETQTTGTLENILEDEFNINILRSGIVHRIDKETSGILLVAKNTESLENLQAQFKDRKTKKEYLALVHGLLESPGRVEGGIERNPVKREKFMVSEDGKEATTDYEPISSYQFSSDSFQSVFNNLNKIQTRKLEKQNYGQFTLLRCFPKTGRTHQIRVHLKYINHPIISDEKYVGRKMYRLDKRWCPRLFLHARKIGFYHPKSKEWMELSSPVSDDLKKVLNIFHE